MSDSIEAILKDTYAEGVKCGVLNGAKNLAKAILKESARYKGMDGQEAARSIARSIRGGTAVAAEDMEGKP